MVFSNSLGGGGIADFSFSEGSGDGQMGKLEFLELLTAQLKHQDPMAPADDKAFIAQLAQFSALEQQMKGNDMLSRIEMAQGAMLTSQATGLIGKEVTAEGDQIFVDPNAPPPPIRFSVDDNAARFGLRLRTSSVRLFERLTTEVPRKASIHLLGMARMMRGTSCQKVCIVSQFEPPISTTE